MYKIIDFYWERANLHIKVDKTIDETVFLINKETDIVLNSKDNEIIIPVYNTPEGEMLKSENWILLTKYNDIVLSPNLINKLDDLSRNFLYRNELYAYLVNFEIDNEMHLIIKTKFMIINYKPYKFHRFSETKRMIRKIAIAIIKLEVLFANTYYNIIHLFSTKKNILFLTENNYELKDNLKCLYDYMKDDNKLNIRVFTNNKFEQKYKNIFKYIKEITYISLSKTIFIDNYTPILTHINLSKKTKLIQLWHAGVGFKSLGYARFGLEGSPHPYKSSHRKYTKVYVDQEKLIDIYKEVFGCKKEIFDACGMPRLDGYLSKEKIKSITDKLYIEHNILKDKKTILFSPTFRGNNHSDANYDYSQIDLDKIYKFCEDNNFVFIIKMHPFITEKIIIPNDYKDKIFDFSEKSINDLIYISDIMVTDYSSCAYEYSLFNRPLIFYRYDKLLYEYKRPLHTLNLFTEKQYEVQDFNKLIEVLNEIKDDIIIKNRFNDLQKRADINSCKYIKDNTLGG